MRAATRRMAERLLTGLVPAGPPPEPRARGEVLISAAGLGVRRGGRRVLDGVDLTVRAGELVGLVGPNGAGKSTLLGALAGDVAGSAGVIEVEGRALAAWTPLELGQRRAVLPQHPALSFPFLVEDVVAMGRHPWHGTALARDDATAVRSAIVDTDIDHLVGRHYLGLSGGERARVALARVLAQRAQLLLLDEPTAALDVFHQELVMRALRTRVGAGSAAVVVLHDLALAAAHADRVIVVDEGRIDAAGPPCDVLTSPRLTRVYRHPIDVIEHPSTGAQLVLPVRPSIEV